MLTRWSDRDRMFGTTDLLRSRLNRLFTDFDRSCGYGPGWKTAESMPKTNLYDNGDTFEIRAEVPGMAKEDIHVKIQGNSLEISGTRKSDAPEGYSAQRKERDALTFSRSFTLSSEVDAEKVEASLENGILVLTLPKSEAAKPKQITIH
ncbi:MAG: Hsp20/alpha crystallin family protein [Desulfobulbaceae bacterium]|nr:Hsp20/alpha crystallin family protein [Desulfobulbaceae bacterium]